MLIGLGVFAQHKGWIDLTGKHSRGSGTGGGIPLGGIDEVFQPTRYEAALQQETQSRLPAPAPLPGDGDKNIYRGNVKIDLGEVANSSASASSDPDIPGASPRT